MVKNMLKLKKTKEFMKKQQAQVVLKLKRGFKSDKNVPFLRRNNLVLGEKARSNKPRYIKSPNEAINRRFFSPIEGRNDNLPDIRMKRQRGIVSRVMKQRAPSKSPNFTDMSKNYSFKPKIEKPEIRIMNLSARPMQLTSRR